ncbi:MAG: hypothetical protein IIA88_07295 [Bacteroidetes bacterium]|nr:hypothetical protein [Bacteroidota bacterium]
MIKKIDSLNKKESENKIKFLGTGYWLSECCHKELLITQNPVTRAQKLFIKSTKDKLKINFIENIEIPIQIFEIHGTKIKKAPVIWGF